MGSLEFCCLVPHAPILVPAVGGREVQTVRSTVDAMQLLGDAIKAAGVDTLVMVSPPHVRLYSERGFSVRAGDSVTGSFARFRAPDAVVDMPVDGALVEAIVAAGAANDLQVTPVRDSEEPDWGALVPLYYLGGDCRLVAMQVSPYLTYQDHYTFGTLIRKVIEETPDRKVVFVASGDMSHRLTRDAPSGYSPRGKDYDAALVDIMRAADFKRIFQMDQELLDEAGEDALWSVSTLAGTMDGLAVESEVLSYEGPFGVGYMVARVTPAGVDPSRKLMWL